MSRSPEPKSLREIIDGLDERGLKVVMNYMDERVAALGDLPLSMREWIFRRGFSARVVLEEDGRFTGQVAHFDRRTAVLQQDGSNLTIHRFAEPMVPVPRGEYVELVKEGSSYQVSRDRGRRWSWLELDREGVQAVLERSGKEGELKSGLEVPQTFEGVYRGRILGSTRYHVLQEVSPDKVVGHCVKDFGNVPTAGAVALIRYSRGGLRWEAGRTRGIER